MRAALGILAAALASVALPAAAGAASDGEALRSSTPSTAAASGDSGDAARGSPPQRRVILLGLRPRGNIARLGRRVANPTSGRYRDFPGQREFRDRFAARRSDRRRVRRYLNGRPGVKRVELTSTQTTALVVMTPAAARR
ncbi:MAG TPA: hypothetical protein VKA36_09560, partial [Solirubrobacterales bacterium]|nr:hypothetical protein [Solirubrobacterales bacterium]